MPTPKSKLTDEQRLERFKAMAHKVEASEDPEEFDRAFNSILRPSREEQNSPQPKDQD